MSDLDGECNGYDCCPYFLRNKELEASLLAHKDQLINAWAEAFWRADVRMDCKYDARYRAEQKYLHYMAHEALNPTGAPMTLDEHTNMAFNEEMSDE